MTNRGGGDARYVDGAEVFAGSARLPPEVVKRDQPTRVVYRSPERPEDVVGLTLDSDGQGSIVVLTITMPLPFPTRSGSGSSLGGVTISAASCGTGSTRDHRLPRTVRSPGAGGPNAHRRLGWFVAHGEGGTGCGRTFWLVAAIPAAIVALSTSGVVSDELWSVAGLFGVSAVVKSRFFPGVTTLPTCP